jgi:ATP-dependent exoDNAse (exonuclease V) alpha subunit
MAEQENNRRLRALPGPQLSWNGVIEGDFKPETDCQAPITLTLKVGALVVVVRNLDDDCVNGTLAKVTRLDQDEIEAVILKSGRVFSFTPVTWKKVVMELDRATMRLVEKVTGTFKQFPLALGYAMTIHKAQGQTMDKVALDVGFKGIFAHGQLYTALSRTRTIEDLHVNRKLFPSDDVLDGRVLRYLGP